MEKKLEQIKGHLIVSCQALPHAETALLFSLAAPLICIYCITGSPFKIRLGFSDIHSRTYKSG